MDSIQRMDSSDIKLVKIQPLEDKNKHPYNVLVLGPGGNKGTAELGLLEYALATKNLIIENLNVIAGVSVGSIIGMLLICGYSINEILTLALDTNLLDFNAINNYKDIAKEKGLLNHHNLEEKLNRMVKAKFGIVPTLEQLYNATGVEFLTVATNVKTSKEKPCPSVVYISYKTEPYLSCVKAVLMSCNIPILFNAIEYKDKIIIDGAFGDPLPCLPYDLDGNRILAVSVVGLSNSGGIDPLDYMIQIITCPIAMIREHILARCSNRVEHIPIILKQLQAFDLNAGQDDKKNSYIQGYMAAKEFFEQKKHGSSIILQKDIEAVFD